MKLLPDELRLGSGSVGVQPDGLIESRGSFTLVEAKRIRGSRFQDQQLAREYLTVLQERGARSGLLWVVLGSPPPVAVTGVGRVGLVEAIEARLDAVHALTACEIDLAEAGAGIRDVVAWTTWNNIVEATEAALGDMDALDDSVRACIARLARAVSQAVEWHR